MKTYYISIFSFLSILLYSSCDAIIEVPDIKNETVVVLAPLEGALIESNAISFFWEETIDAERYRFQVATPNFEMAIQILTDSLINNTNFSKSLSPGNYEWRVRAENSGFETVYTTNSFTVQEPAQFSDNIVVLNAPQDNFLSLQSEVNFNWEDITGTDNYRFQLIDISGSTIIEQELSNSNFTTTISDGRFTWQVRAEMGTEVTNYSSRQIRVDATEPNMPLLSMPNNMTSQTDTQVNFSWSREDLNGTAEFDSIFVYNNEALTMLEFKDESLNKTHNEILLSGSYFWNVKAYDDAGYESDISETFSFTIN